MDGENDDNENDELVYERWDECKPQEAGELINRKMHCAARECGVVMFSVVCVCASVCSRYYVLKAVTRNYFWHADTEYSECSHIKNKALIDIRLRPGIATSLHASPYGPLRPNVTSSIKPEVHNVSQCRQRRTESRRQGIGTKMSWRSVLRFHRYARGQTDRRSDRQTDRSTPLPYRAE